MRHVRRVGGTESSARALQIALAISVLTVLPSETLALESKRTVRFDYQVRGAKLECPSREELAAAVAARLGYDPFSEAPTEEATERASVAITESKSGLAAELRYLQQNQEPVQRRLESRSFDCHELGRALALALSVAIDPMSLTKNAAAPEASQPTSTEPASPLPVAQETKPAPQETPTTQEKPVAPEPAHPSEKSAPPTAPQNHSFWLMRASVRGSLGWSPEPAPGASLAAGWESGAWQLALVGFADAATGVSRADGGRVSGQPFFGALETCGLWKNFALCALGGVGAYRGVGSGVTSPREAVAPFGAVGGVLRYRVPVTVRTPVFLGVGALSSLSPVHLKLDGVTIFSTSAANVIVELGAELHFLESSP